MKKSKHKLGYNENSGQIIRISSNFIPYEQSL